MSRPTLVRALLVTCSLLGAVPLMAQAPPRTASAPAAPAFPYGKFVLQPAPGGTPDPDALTVAFTDGFMQVYKHGQLTRTDGMLVAGDRWQIWQDTGPCSTPQSIVGTYRWSFVDGVLSFALIEDPCEGRSDKVIAVRFIPTP